MKKILVSGLILFAVIGTAFAQAPVDSNSTTQNSNSTTQNSNSTTHNSGNSVLPKITNPLKKEFSDIPSLIKGLVDIILRLATILAVLALVWVGLKFILAQGNPTEIAKARQALWWVIIGIAILFGAQIIVEIIKGTLSDFVDPTKIKFN